MASGDTDPQDLWIERVATAVGFERFGRKLTGRPGFGPYIFVTLVVAVHIPILSLFGYYRTGTLSMAANPGELFQVPAWIGVVWILLRTKAKYRDAIDTLPDSFDEDIREVEVENTVQARLLTLLGVPGSPAGKADAKLGEIAPTRLKLAILVAGVTFHAVQLLVNPGGLVGPVAALTGEAVAFVRFYVLIPLFLYPIGAEFLAVVVGSLILLPFKIRRATLLDFSDPHGFAGLSPAGELFKSVAVSYFVLLTLFTTFQTVALGASPSGLFSSGFILVGLGLGLVFFFAPAYWVQTFVSTAKEVKIEAIADRTRELGTTEEIFPYAEPESTDDASQYTYNHIRMQRVDATSDFPINFGMVREIMFALILPYVTSLVFDRLLQIAVF